MSNTKESMKLYTEEQLKEAFNCGRLYLGREGDTNFYHLIDKLIPIELPSNEEIWRWWQTQKFQKEQGEQEYTMLYEIDLPKILKSFTEHLMQGGNNEN